MFDRVIIVTKRTALEEILVRRSRGEAAFFLKTRGTSIEEYEAAHAEYRGGVETVQGALGRELPREVVPRELLPNFLFRERDLVIVVGPDGLVVNTAKYLHGQQPMLGVNPDRVRNDGVLVRFAPDGVAGILSALLRGAFRTDDVTLAIAKTNDGQELLAVNDILIGRRDPISARYTLTFRERTERQSSSGVLVCTGVGSTGWMRSVVTGALGIAASATDGAVGECAAIPFGWDERMLCFAVREPFPSKCTKADTIFDWIEEGDELVIESEMPEGGAIFADGVIEDAIEFNAGTVVRVGVANRVARIVTPPR